MRKADIIPLTEVYAVGDGYYPGPGVILSPDPWVHFGRLDRWASDPTPTLRPSLDNESGYGTIRGIHGIATNKERGLLCVCVAGFHASHEDSPEEVAEAEAANAANIAKLPDLGRQVLDQLTAGIAAQPAPTLRQVAVVDQPELPELFQVAVVRPHDVHATWAEYTAREAAKRERDAQLASVKARRREAERTARERIALILDDDRHMPAADHNGKVTLCWADLETLLNHYANATMLGKG